VPGISENPPIRAILFDVDGTLVDSIAMIIAGLGDTYENFTGNRPSDSEIAALIGTPLVGQMKLFGLNPDEAQLQELCDYTIQRYGVHKHLETEFVDAVEALINAHQIGLKTALVTSRNAVEVEILSQHFSGWSAADTAVSASDVVNPKPSPDPALLALERLGVSAEDAIMIGDSVFDLRCARGAGLRSGAVLYGAGKKEDLLAETPDYVFTTPTDLLDWVCNLIEQHHATEENHSCRTDF
jgi:pyrophosphatase PpaX